ncbi:hypothetical protein A0H81_01502 [Grifola frondosa]|uniref:Uncharacterized protein n=1 Tax=Grifola frondosa TaxID=5627 RepID=A0A1C7MRJ6_GRIFR|nr:hypothetical protein A0H81_01502 [Grifola frondosa]
MPRTTTQKTSRASTSLPSSRGWTSSRTPRAHSLPLMAGARSPSRSGSPSKRPSGAPRTSHPSTRSKVSIHAPLPRSSKPPSRVSPRDFHFVPFKLFWERESSDGSDPKRERVYTDIFNSDAMLEADAELRAQPRNPDDDPDIEYAIAPILVWSDATHLASFGSASLWPIYAFFGNLSKYIRAKPRAFAAHHLAYIPKVCLCFHTLNDFSTVLNTIIVT